MYALLTYFVVIGSMGTGEDLFYKCGAPCEEIVHSSQFSRTLFMEPRKLGMSILLLDKYILHTL